LEKVNPEPFQRHGLTLGKAYLNDPRLGFTKKARLIIQPSPRGIMDTLQLDFVGQLFIFRLRFLTAFSEIWAQTGRS
jgi:hypothetical protein